MLLATELVAADAAQQRRHAHAHTHGTSTEAAAAPHQGAVLVTAVHVASCYRFHRSFGAFTAQQARYEARLAAGGYQGLVFQNVKVGEGALMR